MKIYAQTSTLAEDDTLEERPRFLLLETAAGEDAVRAALARACEPLGRIISIPAAAHEANLRQLLPADLAALGITAGSGDEGEVTLGVVRTPVGESYALSYKVT